MECFKDQHSAYFGQDDLHLFPVGFQNDLTMFEKHLLACNVKALSGFVKHNGLQHPLSNSTVASSVCSYLLYTVSCHEDQIVVLAARTALSYQVTSQYVEWAPSQAQLTALALNMGLKEELLSDFSHANLPEFIRHLTSQSEQRKPKAGHPEAFHLQQYVACLCDLLRHSTWVEPTLDTLFTILCLMAADIHMDEVLLLPQLTVCLDLLVSRYDEQAWNNSAKIQDLVELLDRTVPEEEGRLQMVRALPRLKPRGLPLRRVTAYFFLQRLLKLSEIDLPPEVSTGDINHVTRDVQLANLSEEQLRRFFTILSYVDIAVGSERIPTSQREHLKQIRSRLQRQVEKVRDNMDDGYTWRSQLKELMARLSTKWNCMTEAYQIQTTLLDFSQGSQGSQGSQLAK